MEKKPCKILVQLNNGREPIELKGEFCPETKEVFYLEDYSFDSKQKNLFVSHISIVMDDEDELMVCPSCEKFVLKTIVDDREDLSFGEKEVCPDENCDNSEKGQFDSYLPF